MPILSLMIPRTMATWGGSTQCALDEEGDEDEGEEDDDGDEWEEGEEDEGEDD